MKNTKLYISLFLIAFVFTYIGSCYLVPGWRIKLAADNLTYFLESLNTLAPIKFGASLIVGLIILFLDKKIKNLFIAAFHAAAPTAHQEKY